jgi:hypothetical protein
MKTPIHEILNDKDLVIRYFIDNKGKTYYVGESGRYQPYRATSADSLRCFLKFAIPLEEQRRLVAAMHT